MSGGTPVTLVPDIAGSGLIDGGVVASASFLPAAAAYSANTIIDVPKQFSWLYANGKPVATGALVRVLTTIIKIDATALISGEAAYSLACYSVTPPSAQADQAAWTLASADLPSYRGTIPLGTPVDLGAALYIKTQQSDQQDINLTGIGMFGRLITVGGFTAAAIARQVFLYGIVL